MLQLNGKVSIITGASSGIGALTVVFFSNLGSKLVVTSISDEKINETIEKCNPENRENIIKVIGDITQREVQEEIVNKAIEHFGRVDILINNANLIKLGADADDIESMVNYNVKSVVSLTTLCIPYISETRGSIINISSYSSTEDLVELTGYLMSKSALDRYTRLLALDLSEKGVKVSSINPPIVIRELFSKFGRTKEEIDKILEKRLNLISNERSSSPDEVAKAISFLVSDYSSFINSELLNL